MLEFLLFILAQSSNNDLAIDAKNIPVVEKNHEIDFFSPTKIPQKKIDKIAPKLINDENTAIMAMDMSSKKILFQKKSDTARAIASLSKLMTALIILENHEFDEIVSVPLEATQVLGAKIEIYQHEELDVKTLLQSMLITSANDAALALAIFDAGDEKNFVKKMNQKAKELKLHSAIFYNSTGLDIFDKQKNKFYGNSMSARDTLKLTRKLLQNEFFRETVKKNYFSGTSVDGKFFHEKVSTNQLLGTFLNLKGVKTGFTNLAGECFIALGEKNGQEILTVILGSSDRFGETKEFLSWIYDSFEWR